MRIRAFPAIRPPADLASRVASLPYDVGELEDARIEDMKTIVQNNTLALQQITIALNSHTAQLAELIARHKPKADKE
jgi:uncharacterized protein (DUF1015 family)